MHHKCKCNRPVSLFYHRLILPLEYRIQFTAVPVAVSLCAACCASFKRNQCSFMRFLIFHENRKRLEKPCSHCIRIFMSIFVCCSLHLAMHTGREWLANTIHVFNHSPNVHRWKSMEASEMCVDMGVQRCECTCRWTDRSKQFFFDFQTCPTFFHFNSMGFRVLLRSVCIEWLFETAYFNSCY